LGVEIPYSKVFAAQKMMIEACNAVGKPVIVATQMLDSMIRNPRPTRAEVTDVGTAVLDGADAVMLSGETAAGKYPIDSLKAMVSVVWEADKIVASRRTERNNDSGIVWNLEMHAGMDRQEQELDAVAAAAVRSAHEMGAKMIVVITMSGRVARAVARHRPTVPVLAFCTQAAVARRLQLHRSIYPVLSQSMLDPGSASTRMGILRAEAIRTAKELGWARSGDRIVFMDRTQGKEHDLHHFSHNMKVVTLRDS
jgi:pyruvate kinase